ncbi:hypothetical protein AAVH_10502 [Aphelenchoides avenae]|nr:hypothetical protein AAVH_10502 [Aphelenchus avenae]
MDFNRESLESDQLASTAVQESWADDYENLQGDLSSLQHKVASLEKELQGARDEASDKTKRIIELNEYFRLCDKCNRRIGELEAQVTYKDIELQNELRRVELLSKTGKGLREEFQKKGVGRSLDERLRQLGLIGTSSDEDESTSASKLSNWYGSCSGIL